MLLKKMTKAGILSHIHYYLVCSLFMLCSSDCIWAENAEHLYNDFKSNAERVWKQRINEVIRSSVDATISKQTELSLPNSMVAARKDVTQVAWRFDFPRLIVKNHTSEKIDTNDQDLVFCLNEEYFFVLGKTASSETWEVKTLEPVSREPTFNGVWSFLTKSGMANGGLPVYYYQALQMPLSEFIMPDGSFFLSLTSSPSFVVNRLESTAEGYLRMFFSVVNPLRGTAGSPFEFQGGEVVLIPRGWLIHSLRLSYGKWEQLMQCQYEIIEGREFPVLVSKSVKTTLGDGKFYEDTYSYSLLAEMMDPAMFTLSYYGLPEPDFGERRVGWFRIATMIIGVSLIAFALWQMHLKRRKDRT